MPRCKYPIEGELLLEGIPYHCEEVALRGDSQGFCILHGQNPNKNVESFTRSLVRIIQRQPAHNFTGFIFPRDFSFEILRRLLPGFSFRNLSLAHAKLYCPADFKNASFIGDKSTSFYKAEFLGEGITDFSDTVFTNRGDVSFDDTVFSGTEGVSFFKAVFTVDSGNIRFAKTKFVDTGGVTFEHARFYNKGVVDFSGAEFNGKGDVIFEYTNFDCKGTVNFSNAVFRGDQSVYFRGRLFEGKAETDFRQAKFHYPYRVTFDEVDLARCRFLNTDLSRIVFKDVYWTGRRYHSQNYWGRMRVYDEHFQRCDIPKRFYLFLKRHLLALVDRFVLRQADAPRTTPGKNLDSGESQHYYVYNLYNQLIENYDNTNRYHEAGDFFVGKMEMRRFCKFENFLIKPILSFYRTISCYGERPLRAFISLAFVILLLGLLNLSIGIELQRNPIYGVISPDNKGYYYPIIKPENTKLKKPSIRRDPLNYTWFSPGIKADYCEALCVSLKTLTFGKVQADYAITDPFWRPVAQLLDTILGYSFLSFFILSMNRKFRRVYD